MKNAERGEFAAAEKLSLPARLFIQLIKAYQLFISPRSAPCCRFTPSCSQYAIDAVRTHGAFKGFFLAAWRVLRCNPFSKGGYDPVPEKKTRGSGAGCKKQKNGRRGANDAKRLQQEHPSSSGTNTAD